MTLLRLARLARTSHLYGNFVLPAVEKHLIGPLDVPRQADLLPKADSEIRDVDLPPAVAVGRGARVGVMIIVPAFAVRGERDEPVVAAVLAGVVITVAPKMRSRVNAPGYMPRVDC